MDIYEHPKSSEWFERATKVIPGGIYGHLGPAEGCFMPISAYPLYLDHAQGSHFWDIDGNEYLDFTAAYGPNILGYNDPDVNAAVTEQMNISNCTVLPSTKMVELAELLTETVSSADWAFFAKNGGDVTTMAVMTARAYTGRAKIVMFRGSYHGVAGWTQKGGYAGITMNDIADSVYTEFGDITALKRTFAQHKGNVACLIATPYHHPIFEDNMLPPDGYWQKVRQLCNQEGVVLIIDDVRCGFRLDVRGSDVHYGFEADLACYCKALANGWNISALTGKEELKEAAASVFYTGSYWLSAVPMAAALACIKKMREIDVAKICTEKGKELTSGLVQVAKDNGFTLKVSGEPAMWYMRTTAFEDRVDNDFKIHQAFVAECVRRGVFFVNHHNLFMNASVSDADIERALEVADQAYKAVRPRINKILGKDI